MKSISFAIAVAGLLIAGAMGAGVYVQYLNNQTAIKHAAVQGCITVLPEVNPGWYNKCMAEKGYQTNLTY